MGKTQDDTICDFKYVFIGNMMLAGYRHKKGVGNGTLQTKMVTKHFI